jgi:hypothetical protein
MAMRSRFGVGTTPPNVLVTPKPVSSVMIKRTFGAPLGGTTRAGQYGVDCAALRSILPRNTGAPNILCTLSALLLLASSPLGPASAQQIMGTPGAPSGRHG